MSYEAMLRTRFKVFNGSGSLRLKTDKNILAFFALVRAGLWEQEVRLSQFGEIDFKEIYLLAAEQSVVGLVAAGIEHVIDMKVPQDVALMFVGATLQLEQQNIAMNEFVGKLIKILRKDDVYAVLVKGQGIAQCYERPLWRTSGDVDLLLSDSNYEKAKATLLPLAIEVETEYKLLKHFGMTLKEGFVVELHGMLHSRLSNRIDETIDEVQHDVFCGGNVRPWENKGTPVFLPAPDNDVIFIFTHILKHFYIEGIGLRQICDWCRLLWTYKDSLDYGLLESRLRKMGLMTEWKAFAAFAVEYLGMPVEAMPFYDVKGQKNSHRNATLLKRERHTLPSREEIRWKKKAERILDFVLETGNFGHNRELKRSKNFFIAKIQAALFKMNDFARHARLFPLDSVKFYCHYLFDGVRQACA